MARFYNRGWRRNWYRRGVSSSKKGTTTFTCRIPLEDVVQFKIPATTVSTDPHYWSNLICTCSYASFTTSDNLMNLSKGSLLSSYLYRTYTRIYDQVKVNAVSVTVGLMEGVGIGGLSALRLYTNWDRDYTFEELTSATPTTAEQLGTGSESQSYLMVNNSRQTFRRYIAARDVQERTTYHDCSYTFHQRKAGAGGGVYNEGYYGDNAWAPLVVGREDGNYSQTVAYGVSRACGFTPSLMMAIWSPTTFAAERVIPVSLKVTYSVTFRMPKFGLASAGVNAKFSDMRQDAVDEVMDEKIENESEVPVLKKKKVVYEEEMIPDDEPEEDDDDEQEPLTQSFKSPMKKAGKKSSS